MWEISSILPDGTILPQEKNNKKVKDALKVLQGDSSGVSTSIIHACKISRSNLQRNAIELLLLSEDCKQAEISALTGVKAAVIKDFVEIFFRYKKAFMSRIDILDYIESGVDRHSSDTDDKMLMSFLYKRWAFSLGKEFVIWRFQLKPVDYTPGILFNSVVQEAFFYHKEKSMGKEDISIAEYLRSTKVVLDNIKASLSVKDESKDDDVYDMKKELDIIIQDTPAFDTTLEELKGDGSFINNA
jgi:hypothetical protein